uniref:Uncharacterized protein n=1 Tax=Cricetulus griseus TaxID=10029 RepID=A0A8C2QCU0_CRIGR
PAREHRARHRPGSPDEERGSAPRQVMDPRGNSVLPAGTQRREEGSYRRDSVGAEADAARRSGIGPGGLPPAAAAAAPSAGSLRPAPPPPPPSSAAAAAAAGKGAEETASLPLPTARAQLGPTVRKSATSVRRVVARAPNVTGATRRGAGLRRLAGPREAPRGSPAARGWRRAHLSRGVQSRLRGGRRR